MHKDLGGLTLDAAEHIAVQALVFVTAEQARLSRFMTLTGLTPMTTYHFRARSTSAGGLTVTSDPPPKVVRLWQADAPTRDFRKAVWKDQTVKGEKGAAVGETTAPEKGCRVFYLECGYERDDLTFHLSTQLRIIGRPAE